MTAVSSSNDMSMNIHVNSVRYVVYRDLQDRYFLRCCIVNGHRYPPLTMAEFHQNAEKASSSSNTCHQKDRW